MTVPAPNYIPRGSGQWAVPLVHQSNLIPSCGQDLPDDVNLRQQPHKKAYDPTTFFKDGSSARPLLPGVEPTNPPGGKPGVGLPADNIPQPAVTLDLLKRGQQRYDIYCSMCHGRDGNAEGMVVQRGFPAPPSFHKDTLRTVADQQIFDVITSGLGKMPPYGRLVAASDRWAIIAYIRALQLSQNAPLEAVPAEHRTSILPPSPVPIVQPAAEAPPSSAREPAQPKR
jgi:mono/diheme cytochrome c family protein